MLDKKIAKLDFTKPAAELHNLIRGLSPWPVAHTTCNGKLLKVHRAILHDRDGSSGGGNKPGAVIDRKKLIGRLRTGFAGTAGGAAGGAASG